jgi:hypothetical protein
MDDEAKIQILLAEIKRINQSLLKTEDTYIKKMEKLNSQLIGFKEAFEILKSR